MSFLVCPGDNSQSSKGIQLQNCSLSQDPDGVPTTEACGAPGFPRNYYTDALSNPVAHSQGQWPVPLLCVYAAEKVLDAGAVTVATILKLWLQSAVGMSFGIILPSPQPSTCSNLDLKSKYILGRHRKASLLLMLKDHTPSVCHPELQVHLLL